MEKLILYPTDTAQWQALINEAELVSSVTLEEELESYLVFLLMRFCNKPEMAKSVLGLEFLASAHESKSQRYDSLREVGDKCLLFSGLFPGQAEKRQVKVSYFVELGQSAYYSLSNASLDDSSQLYSTLSDEFVSLKDVLQATRGVFNYCL